MTFKEAAVLARDAHVGELWLTHYSPSLIRPEDFMEKCAEDFSKCLPGKRRKEHGVKLSGRVMCNGGCYLGGYYGRYFDFSNRKFV